MRVSPEKRFVVETFQETYRSSLHQIYYQERAKFSWVAFNTIQLADFERDTDGEKIMVACYQGRPVGFVSIWEAENFVHHLFVDSDFQSQGVGSLLLNTALSGISGSSQLKCVEKNKRALVFYRKRGWEIKERAMGPDGPYLLLAKKATQ